MSPATCLKMNRAAPHPKKWRRLAIGASATSLLLMALGVCAFYTATLSLSDHRNLYYTLWKLGLRDYDQTVAKAGMFHDRPFRESLKGLTVEEFETVFPNTFFEMQGRPPCAIDGRSYFVDSYPASRSDGQSRPFVGWVAEFENGRLVGVEWEKGV